MEDWESKIVDDLVGGKSAVIVGPSDSGKTYWVKNFLIPKLQSLNKIVSYASRGDEEIECGDIGIFDEAETLFDKDRLQAGSGTAEPYYSEDYLEKVKEWHENYARHKEPTLYLISRNEDDVEFLKNSFKKADWDGRCLNIYAIYKK